MAPKPVPFVNIGPGQIIQRSLEALNWTNKDLAEVVGMSEKTISLLVNNKQSVTVDSAVLLGKAFGSSPEFWMNLEQAYRMRQRKEGKRERDTAVRAEIRRYLPIAEMRKKGWISCGRSAESQERAAKEFLGTEDLDLAEYRSRDLPFCARQGKRLGAEEGITRSYSLTWYKKAQAEADAIRAAPYSPDKAAAISASLKDYARKEDGLRELLGGLNAAGIKFLVLSHLSKTYLDGASFWSGANPVIVYTARYDRLDNFWWTIGHELAHILLHLKDGEGCFLDNLDDKDNVSRQEREADEHASKVFGVKQLLEAAEPFKHYLTEARLSDLSQACGLAPFLAIGILQHRGYVDYRSLPHIRRAVLDKLPRDVIRG